MTEEIRPCPFCGPGTHMQAYLHGQDIPDCFIQCGTCSTTGPLGKNEDLAIAVWNRRAAPATLNHDHIRSAGGIIHKDGNIFFTNLDVLHRAIAAVGSIQTQNGECNECGKKQADGWALYCVDCASSAKMGCNFPLCQSPEEQQRIAAQVHAELYSGIPPELLQIATGYEGGVMTNGPEDLSGDITLRYQSPPEAEAAFECITDLIDAINANRNKSDAKP